jgi:hypothetical protein
MADFVAATYVEADGGLNCQRGQRRIMADASKNEAGLFVTAAYDEADG